MLVQEAGDKILLLPAWPADWDVDFKLRLAGGVALAGVVKDGKLLSWDITPPARKKDVTVCPLQTRPPTPSVPPNTHPLRAGADQSGANKFRGQIGRVTMFRCKLAPQTIKELAAGDRTKPVALPQVVACWMNPKPGDLLPTQAEDFAGAVSFEAWIFPQEKESSRILDKLTPGKDDGILLDTFPDLSLRLIAGNQKQVHPNVLKPGVWQHVAVSLDRGMQRVYLDGRPVGSAK
ncbi:MAG: hypothetical protein NTX50_25945, partial [Candidatus Sumerlaeota bacterium]|nr:hypothetical protein [Candidatus Sumerlaeota bacterium]